VSEGFAAGGAHDDRESPGLLRWEGVDDDIFDPLYVVT